MTEAPDPFRYDDAAYVLGALDDADRAAFEAHLETCAACRARVEEARAGRDLLAGLAPSDLQGAAPVPDTMLAGLVRAARRERNRRRWLTTSLGAAAAACAIALTIVLWPASSGPSGPPAQAMHQVRPGPVSATAKLIAKGWGTEIDLECRYTDSSVERYVPYSLVVVDKLGNKYQAGSWTLAPGPETTFTGGTAVQIPDIAKVQITLQDGTPILQLTT
jgi:hypothetical protein